MAFKLLTKLVSGIKGGVGESLKGATDIGSATIKVTCELPRDLERSPSWEVTFDEVDDLADEIGELVGGIACANQAFLAPVEIAPSTRNRGLGDAEHPGKFGQGQDVTFGKDQDPKALMGLIMGATSRLNASFRAKSSSACSLCMSICS